MGSLMVGSLVIGFSRDGVPEIEQGKIKRGIFWGGVVKTAGNWLQTAT